MPLGRLLQEKQILLDGLAEHTERGFHVAGWDGGEGFAGDEVLKGRFVVGELEERWETDGEELGEEVGVQFPNSVLTAWDAAVDAVSLLGDEIASKSYAIEVIFVNGDEFRWCVGTDS